PVKRRQYTAVALPVLPWLGFRLNSWLGAAIGAALAACGTGPGAQSPGTHPDRRCDATGRRSGCSRDQRP
ncbi:MAG: hypothetical protein ACXV3A_02515, partial [Kineosporiaceae bacterium]